ncbi:UvrB/UvrC motif-containing protein [Sphingomonas sp. TZW2008]|uniref:UvrB/UvrC motif-containing protein n=1 Tax=Sphingomonas sp. TZW2008 TaxID=1917973 RepID=UPI000A26B468|nr:UvrB/UvrC motif-containing protein [Sphingomonas sp. TZW2008]
MTAEELQRAMDAAAAALDFEAAGKLRDRLAILRQTGEDPGDVAGLSRQQPGAMGLGTSQARVTPPDGWIKPRKPDPMTRGRNNRRGD